MRNNRYSELRQDVLSFFGEPDEFIVDVKRIYQTKCMLTLVLSDK